MKTVAIVVAETPIIRNLLRGDFMRVLRESGSCRVILVTNPDKKERFAKEFEDLEVVSVKPDSPKFLEKVLIFISKNSLKTGTVTFVQKREPDVATLKGFLKLIIKRFLWNVFGRSSMVQKLARRLELSRAPSESIALFFDTYKPDLIFSTIGLNTSADIPLLIEAKRRKIKTVGMVRGWDNFTSHGFLRVIPDHFLLQDEYLREVGIKYQFLKPEGLTVVGFPQYDYYFDSTLKEPREEFFKRLGISSDKKLILFGAMGDFLFAKEGEIAEIFEELVEEEKIPNNLVMLFRAHPAFDSPLEKMKSLKHVISDRNAVYPAGNLNDWDMGRREVSHLINSIVHSEMVINAGSTIGLDAIALEKPAISIAFEKTKMPYWFSAARFRDAYTHYEDLMRLGGMAPADSKEELARVINRYLKDPKADSVGREEVKKKFFSPFDGKVGERIGKIIIRELV